MKRRLFSFLIAFIGLFAVAAVVETVRNQAAGAEETVPVDGNLYRIVNAGYGHAMTASGAGNITAADPNDDDAQLWLAVANPGGGFYLRNYKTGYYLTSSRRRSAPWQAEFTVTPDPDKTLLTFIPDDGTCFIHTLNGYGRTDDEGTHGFAHEDGGKKVVGWNTNSVNTRWKLIRQTTVTPEMIAARKKTWASCVSEILPGKAYRIRNYSYGHNLAPDGDRLSGRTPDENDPSQIWIVERNPAGEGYVLRNFDSGKIVTSSCQASQRWTLRDIYLPDPEKCVMQFNKKTTGFGFSTLSTFKPDNERNDFTYAHEDNTNSIVGWEVNSTASIWHFTEAEEYTPAIIAAKRETWDCFKKHNVDSALAAIFTDAACTELTPAYAAMDPALFATDPNVLSLPEGLRPMVMKIRTGDWSETDPYNGNQWDSEHARKFRLMLAEPFSDSGGASGLACVQAHGDLNNPTGIVTDNGSVLYVMLDEEPAPGSEFRIAGRTGEGTPLAVLNNTSDGILLHKGLNIINCDKDLADMIIYYIVRTNNRQRAVTDYSPIKVHIEGGSLNGYFNYEGDALYTPDTNEDWLYYRERARHAMFCLLSKYNALYIHFDDIFDDAGNRTPCLKSLCSPEAYKEGRYDLRATMKAWDEMYIAETLIMGWHSREVIEAEKAAGRDYYDPLEGDDVARADYYKYINNRHLGISLRECAFMNATWWRTAYNPGTISSIIREFPTGDLWGPAHEMGHLNQGPMNMAGCTEESNNVFSNVALFYRGTHSSRADYPSVQRARFNAGENFHQHSTWGTTRMWFQLWLYYHCAGNNKKFYPRLYELLRKNPIRRTPAPGHEGEVNPMLAKDDLLHFAKMACVAAGEDLTDFFDAWGFLRVQDGYFIGDYTSYTSYLSAEEITQWRKEIAQMAEENNWPKNQSIIFIDDRVGSDRKSYEFDKNKCGSMGGLKDFINGAPVSGNYSFTISGTTVQVTGGSGGVGFLIHDADGHLIGFANDPVFEVSAEAADKIRAGEFTFEVMSDNNQPVKVVDAVHEGSLDQRLEAIDVLLEKSREVLSRSDKAGLNPGLLRPEFVVSLQEVYDDVKAKRDAGEITAGNNVAIFDTLYEKYMEVKDVNVTEDKIIPIVPGGIYVFTSNVQYPGKGMKANDKGTQLATVGAGDVNLDDEAQQWVFEPAGEEGYYYIRNVKFNKYIGKAPADKGSVTLVDNPVKQLVVFRELGAFSISPEGNDHDSLHDDGNNRLTRWDSSTKGSRWTLTMLNGWEEKSALLGLLFILEKAEILLEEAGGVSDTAAGVVGTPLADYQFVTPDMLADLYGLISEGKRLSADTAAATPKEMNDATLA
ncbi:MAG: M60 family metallopeptidase, partial [Muribaculaceae bacterium]|nr:M60 family metallopeptidase [Muribaculaceae bacterium]